MPAMTGEPGGGCCRTSSATGWRAAIGRGACARLEADPSHSRTRLPCASPHGRYPRDIGTPGSYETHRWFSSGAPRAEVSDVVRSRCSVRRDRGRPRLNLAATPARRRTALSLPPSSVGRRLHPPHPAICPSHSTTKCGRIIDQFRATPWWRDWLNVRTDRTGPISGDAEGVRIFDRR